MASKGIFHHSTNCEGSGAVAMRDVTACTRDAGVVIRRLRRSDWPLLLGMYDAFVPLGAALGLPPRSAADRRRWLCALGGAINLGAFAEGRLIGHLALLPVGALAELAVFVHQDVRRRGVATALINSVLGMAAQEGCNEIHALIDPFNTPARVGLRKLNFRCVRQGPEGEEYALELAASHGEAAL